MSCFVFSRAVFAAVTGFFVAVVIAVGCADHHAHRGFGGDAVKAGSQVTVIYV